MAPRGKSFRLDDSVPLPVDTIILEPGRAPQPKGRSARSALPRLARRGQDSPANDRNIVASGDGEMAGKLLAVSAARASYLVLDADLRPSFELLLAGGSLRQALQVAKRTFPRDGRARLRNLLTDVELMGFYEHATPREDVPSGACLQFYVTNGCNLRCRHCYMSSGPARSTHELNPQERLRVIELFARVHPGGMVTLTGGEPLTCPDIFSLVDHAFACGLKVQLFTNGLLLDAATLARLVDHVHLLQISLDGATAATHDALRGRGTFRGVLQALRLMDRASAAHRHLDYRIAVTVSRSNQASLAANLPRLLKRLGLKGRFTVAIGGLSRVGRAATHPGLFSSHDETTTAQLGLVDRLAQASVYQIRLPPGNVFTRTCGFGAVITVAADGGLYPCSIIEQPPLGNIRDANAEQVMAALRAGMEATAVDRISGCAPCPIRYLCGGLCRITNFHKTGSYTTSACTEDYQKHKIRALMRTFQSIRVLAGLA